MGLLSKGTPLEWDSSKQHHAYVKHHGILQFLAIFHAQKSRADDNFLWYARSSHAAQPRRSTTTRTRANNATTQMLSSLPLAG